MAHTSGNDEAINVATKGSGACAAADDEVKKQKASSSSSKATIFHDFLGKGFAPESSSPPVVVGSAGGGKPPPPSEASPSASASLGGGSSAGGGGGLGPISTTSDLASERHAGNHFEGVPFYGPRGVCSGPGTNIRFAGTKRSNSDSFVGSSREKPPSMRPDSLESSHLTKLLRNAGGEQPRRSHDEEPSFVMHPMRPISASIISQPSAGGRTDANSSKWDRAIPVNIGPVLQYPPCAGQVVPFGYQTPANKSQDANAGPSVISQAAADEGSRTGIKGSGILNSINATAGVTERNISGVLTGRTPNSRVHISEPESSIAPSRHGLVSAGRQMTIFYGGQAHVFDNVHPNKADVIMALAGSNGGSWSTTYATKSASRILAGENCTPTSENETGTASNIALPQELLGRSLVRGNSMHGLGSNDRVPISIGIHQRSITTRETKASVQAADPSNKDKREV